MGISGGSGAIFMPRSVVLSLMIRGALAAGRTKIRLGSFGEGLKKEREKRKVTLDEIAQVTKISTRSLRALEEEEFSRLPGGIFNRGFVRAYARQLGLDEDKLIADYLVAAGETPVEPTPEGGPRITMVADPVPEPEPSRLPWGRMAIVVAVVAAIVAGWMYYNRHGAGSSENSVAPTTQSDQLITGPATDVQSAPASSNSTLPSGAPIPAPSSADGFDVQLRARDEVWMSVSADGEPAHEDRLLARQTRTLHAKRGMILRIGNAGEIEVSFNGKPLGKLGDEGEVRNLTFGPTGLEAGAPASTPSRKSN